VSFAPGDRVTVRGERWLVQEATAFPDVTLLDLVSATDHHAAAVRCRLLTPFDRPVATARAQKIRAVTRRRWMRRLQAHLAGFHSFGQLRTARSARIDIFPFQLEPALAVIRGAAPRLLLADEVGLGKTIQTGIALAELQQRGWCHHALIVTPAGLRQQWCDELRERFGIRAVVIDAGSLAGLVDSLPFDVNPWAVESVTITSIDFAKQPEVLRGLTSHIWDVLIVDEAHQAAIATQRYDAVNTLAKRARHVMLLTATPHAGRDDAYQALCAIGQIRDDEPIRLFRRTREIAGRRRSRRVHLLPVAQGNLGHEMHRLLDAYLEQVWNTARTSGTRDVQLVAMVLAKRAFSCARSLAASLEKRLAGLNGAIEAHAQASLPFDFDDESDAPPLPITPAFDCCEDERVLLERLLEAAIAAQKDDRKMRALQRLAVRLREPLIIFTEYRDTVDAIAAAIGSLRKITLLHGGQTPLERRESLRMFTTGKCDVMIATDAGSEGLNLHHTCRVIINLELPWNPIRLEQRIGRVDRIGQTRTVHAINLLAEGTAERTVLASLLRRIDRIRMSDIEVAACVINNREPPPRAAPVDSCAVAVDFGQQAHTEARRIADIRRLPACRSDIAEQIVSVTTLTSTERCLIAFFRARLVTRTGRLIEDTLVPVRMGIDTPTWLSHRSAGEGAALTRKAARALAESLISVFGPALLRHARTHAEKRAHVISVDLADSIAPSIARERAIAALVAAQPASPVQAGLFDTRSLKERWTGEQHRESLRDDSETRAQMLEGDAGVRLAADPELAMLLIACSQD
jgi:superfamily II DNA or RNA helicase